MADVLTFTPTGGSQIDLNDGSKYAARYGVNVGAKKTQYDEVRSYTGAIRQVDVHQPLVEMVIPLEVMSATADGLRDNLDALCDACVAGGSLTWQPDGEDSRTYTIGCSPEPEIVQDALYKLKHITLVELHLVRLP